MALLEVQELERGFGSKTFNTRIEVLKGVNLSLRKGELVALMGPSGCGKSTLLNIIGGLLRADSGKIKLKSSGSEYTYGKKKPSGVVDVRRNGVGWIFQDFHLLEQLTAQDNVALALEIKGMKKEEADEKAIEALVKVGLEDRIDFPAGQLSGGQQQRVAVARAISGSRPLLLADEPTGNLDVKSGEDVLNLFKELCSDPVNPISILMVTHDPMLATKADRMLLMRDGITAASNVKEAWGVTE
ncbi:MAG: macrolide ABC transporter ATP-binding protein [Euryarchaeota archaeon]|nr:macrolide ABC transporter ATP-binding protein [Euryarchaeota archaeon]|tara:strand:+ start:22825 stop:23553 length:729 start_codon:yes stop_codon:yes gene_type:complete